MVKRCVMGLCAIGAVLWLSGCGWMGGGESGWDAMAAPDTLGAQSRDGRAVLVLETFRLLPEKRARKGSSCFIRGVVVEGVFYPDAPLRVEGKPCETPDPRPLNWVPGWVEFAPLQRHLDMEAVSPRQPNIHGVFAPDGRFYPDTAGL